MLDDADEWMLLDRELDRGEGIPELDECLDSLKAQAY